LNEIVALILAAGRGTRLLPATKSVPKEMLPLVDRPLIHYTLEEAISSGLDHAIMVTSGLKDAVHHYFDPDAEVDRMMAEKGDGNSFLTIEQLVQSCEISYVRQREPKGIADAVRSAQRALAGRAFVLYFPDDIIVSKVPVTRQLLDVHKKYGATVIAVERVPKEHVSRYGIVDADPVGGGVYKVKGLVEKPKPEDAPSDLAIVGRYVITPGIFDAIAETTPGAGGELQITDALQKLSEREPVYALAFEGRRYDTGNPTGYLRTAVALALERPDLRDEMRQALKELLSG